MCQEWSFEDWPTFRRYIQFYIYLHSATMKTEMLQLRCTISQFNSISFISCQRSRQLGREVDIFAQEMLYKMVGIIAMARGTELARISTFTKVNLSKQNVSKF